MFLEGDEEAAVTDTDTETAQTTQHYTHILIRAVLILSSHLYLAFRRFFNSWDFAIKFVYGFSFQLSAIYSLQIHIFTSRRESAVCIVTHMIYLP